MTISHSEWVRLLPAGTTTRTEAGEELELSLGLIRAFWAETERRRALHEERGNRFNPPVYLSEAPHEISSRELGYAGRLEVRDDGGYAELLLNETGERLRQRGEIRGLSPGIEPVRDDELAVEFSSHLTEVSPTARPRFQSAQLDAPSGEQSESESESNALAAAVAASGTRLQLSEDLTMSNQTVQGQSDGQGTGAPSEGAGGQDGGQPAEQNQGEGQDGDQNAAEMSDVRKVIREEARSAVSEAMSEVTAQLQELREALDGMMASEGEPEVEGSAGDDADGGGLDEAAVDELVDQKIRAKLGGGTTEEVGGGEAGGGNQSLEAKFDDYDEAYEELKQEHGPKQASKILASSGLEPEE